MTKFASFPAVEIPFDKDGNIAALGPIPAGNAKADLLAMVAGLDDLIVISHGWNNDPGDAKSLYGDLLNNVDLQWTKNAQLDAAAKTRTGVLAVYWPSKKFDQGDIVAPSGGAQGGALASIDDEPAANEVDYAAKLAAQIGNLCDEFGQLTAEQRTALAAASADIAKLETDSDAQKRFVKAVASLVPENPEEHDPALDEGPGNIGHPKVDGAALLQNLDTQVTAAAGAPVEMGAGGLSNIGSDDSAGDATTAPTGMTLGFDPIGGIKRAALLLLNCTTYYTMKERAGTIGRVGVMPLVAAAVAAKPGLRVHLVGHSFGGRLVTSLANAMPAGTSAATMTLLQAAYSHYGLAPAPTAGQQARPVGAFRSVVTDGKVRGGIQITHSNHDWAVGIAYPVASFIKRQVAASIDVPSTANSLWGGMGANGAQQTLEAFNDTMLDEGKPYPALPNGTSIRNITGNAFIDDHSSVRGPQCAWALLQLMKKSRSG